MPTIKAIETRYKGHRFRSRLEARWAVALDHMGIKWQYEPEGYNLGDSGCYLPDFLLPELNTYLEIKPGPPSEDEKKKLNALLKHKQAFGAWGFDFNSYPLVLHQFPDRKDRGLDNGYCDNWLTNNWLANPWPSELPRLTKGRVFYSVPVDESKDMVCPVCASNYVHVGDPVTLTDDYPHAIGSRGPIHVFDAASELCPHRWQLVVAFHKGNTTLAVTIK